MRIPPAEGGRDDGAGFTGRAGLDWLAKHSLSVDEPPSGGLRVFADEVSTDELTIGRLHHNARRVVRRPSADRIRIAIVVDGDLRADDGTSVLEVGKGQGYAHSASERLTMTSSAACGAVGLELSADFPLRLGVAPPRGLILLSEEVVTLRLLLAVVVTTLNSGVGAADPGWRYVVDTVESAAAAVLDEVGPSYPRRPTAASDRLLQRSREVIAAHYSDRTFGVATLAALVSVAPSSLHAAYADAGTTPLNEIRRVRLAAARRILRRRNQPTRDDEEEVALLVGFRSRRALRAAHRLLDHPPPTGGS